ncbi:ABC transporter permease subunit [Myxococcota bacterium]|nr:ABC transporter permease subunit [Myxococcota bacterium]
MTPCRSLAAAAILFALCVPGSSATAQETDLRPVQVGSKNFTENVLLGEMATLLIRTDGLPASHREAIGGTRVVFDALVAGDIDIYPEYTGTLKHEILADLELETQNDLRDALAERGLLLGPALGFQNNYALGMKARRADELGIRNISDLVRYPKLVFRFGNEFMDRRDGWPVLRDRYRLPQSDVRGVDHDIAYRGIDSGGADLIDLYTTDAEISYYGLRALEDDLGHFPSYEAVWLLRNDLLERAPDVIETLSQIGGQISEPDMIAMNARVKLDKTPAGLVAANFLRDRLGIRASFELESDLARFWRCTVEHLTLVGVSLGAAILVSIPLGIAAARHRRLGRLILSSVGVIQTIPSLALLVFMIPLLGIGGPPAMVALFLYSLLPVVRNTHAGLSGIPIQLRESAEALGLPPNARLRRIELPLAMPSILAGIKTSAVINVGTATLGALVGAGGYGQPILTGIRLDDVNLILQGAVPAAVLALLVQGFFDVTERVTVPKGLQLEAR